jgi:hypothetical protein
MRRHKHVALYRALLRLYPAEYQDTFGPEMTQVFLEASASLKKRKPHDLTLFTIREYLGLFRGALMERASKSTQQDRYMKGLSPVRPRPEGQDEIAEVRSRLEALLSSMEAAIAHHDFSKARFYSDEERIARLHLQRLIDDAESRNLALGANAGRDLYGNASV